MGVGVVGLLTKNGRGARVIWAGAKKIRILGGGTRTKK